MGMIASTVLPSLVPLKRIDDCVEIHILHKELCDLLLLNHQNFPNEVRVRQCAYCMDPL